MYKPLFFLTLLSFCVEALTARQASDNKLFISTIKGEKSIVISENGASAPLLISSHDWPGVIRAFRDLQSDIGKITSVTPELLTDKKIRAGDMIIAGTIGKSPIIDRLIKKRKIDVTGVAGQWETFVIQVVKRPLPGVKRGLVIAGSDKRGTIYGIY